MLKDITLGQFFPGDSIIHRLDPRMKLILAIFYIVILFLARDLFTILFLFALSLILIPISKIPMSTIVKSLKPLRFILIFTSFFNIFWGKGDTVLVNYGIIHIYLEGVLMALIVAIRIIALLIGTTLLLTYTTSPITLTSAIEQLLSPLRKIHVPVHDFAMMMSIALRFIPTLIEETDKIMSAQKARGADFETGSLLARAKALIPVFIPLFVSSIRRADELATAMECRCYHGGEGRTRMTILRYHAADFIALALITVLCAAVVASWWLPIPKIFLL